MNFIANTKQYTLSLVLDTSLLNVLRFNMFQSRFSGPGSQPTAPRETNAARRPFHPGCLEIRLDDLFPQLLGDVSSNARCCKRPKKHSQLQASQKPKAFGFLLLRHLEDENLVTSNPLSKHTPNLQVPELDHLKTGKHLWLKVLGLAEEA